MAKPTLPLLAFLVAILQLLPQTVFATNDGYKPYPKPFPPAPIFPPTSGVSFPGKSWKPGGFYPQKPFFPTPGFGIPSGPMIFPIGMGGGGMGGGFYPYPGGFGGGKSWGSGGGKPFKQNKGLKGKLSALKDKLSLGGGGSSCLFGSCGDQVSVVPVFIGYPRPSFPGGFGGGFGGGYPKFPMKTWRPPAVLPPPTGRCPRGPPSGPTGPMCRHDSDCGFPRRCCLIRGLKSIDDIKPLCVMPTFV